MKLLIVAIEVHLDASIGDIYVGLPKVKMLPIELERGI
jgi:hypothetical protein